MKYDIFISYRREGGDTFAQLLYDRLSSKGYRVFLDIESLRSGKFNEELLSIMENCKEVIVLLPNHALERCWDPEDWVRREIEFAILNQKNIVTLMMREFTWPEQLPPSMEALRDYPCIHDSMDYFDAFLEKLETLLISEKSKQYQKKYLKESGHVMDTIQNWKKRCCIFGGVLASVGIILGIVFGIARFWGMKNDVTLCFYAPDSVSRNEYLVGKEILEQRVASYFGKEKYSWEEKNGKIFVGVKRKQLSSEEKLDHLCDGFARKEDSLDGSEAMQFDFTYDYQEPIHWNRIKVDSEMDADSSNGADEAVVYEIEMQSSEAKQNGIKNSEMKQLKRELQQAMELFQVSYEMGTISGEQGRIAIKSDPEAMDPEFLRFLLGDCTLALDSPYAKESFVLPNSEILWKDMQTNGKSVQLEIEKNTWSELQEWGSVLANQKVLEIDIYIGTKRVGSVKLDELFSPTKELVLPCNMDESNLGEKAGKVVQFCLTQKKLYQKLECLQLTNMHFQNLAGKHAFEAWNALKYESLQEELIFLSDHSQLLVEENCFTMEIPIQQTKEACIAALEHIVSIEKMECMKSGGWRKHRFLFLADESTGNHFEVVVDYSDAIYQEEDLVSIQVILSGEQILSYEPEMKVFLEKEKYYSKKNTTIHNDSVF